MLTKEEPTQLFIGANIAEKSCQYEPSGVGTKALRSVGVQAAPCTRKGRGILGPLRHGSSAGTATPGLQQTHNSVDLPTAKRTSKQHNRTAYSLGNESKDDTVAEWLLGHTAEPGQRRADIHNIGVKDCTLYGAGGSCLGTDSGAIRAKGTDIKATTCMVASGDSATDLGHVRTKNNSDDTRGG
jgi:hypothetical protein